MRVADLAELTGTTVRAVRHYHALGLLPVPEVRGGWRDYDLSHVARVSRIRWLAAAGIPLSSVAAILDAAPSSGNDAVIEDLEEAMATVDSRLDELSQQRDMLQSLAERARQGGAMSPMPPAMMAFYDRLEESAVDRHVCTAVRRERNIAELACYRGALPPWIEFLFHAPDDHDDARALVGFQRSSGELNDSQIEEIAAANVARIRGRLSDDAARMARRVDPNAIHGVLELFRSADPTRRRLWDAMERRLLETLEELRNTSQSASPTTHSGPGRSA